MESKKIKSQNEFLRIINRLKKQGKKIVFARGGFDLLHLGHLDYLEKAKKLGDILVVWVNSDRDINTLKGKERPIINERARVLLLQGLACVDFAVIFEDCDGLKMIRKFKPDIVAVNFITDDYRKIIEAYGGEIKIIPLLKQYSTTKIINKIFKGNRKSI